MVDVPEFIAEQVQTMCADVSYAQDHVGRKLALHVEAPLLHIRVMTALEESS